VRLTNFRDFREKSKIWPNISAKNRFFRPIFGPKFHLSGR
jgi:hypothetical protein